MEYSKVKLTKEITPEERQWILAPTIKGWIENCSPEDFKKRFAGWKGGKKNFDYSRYKETFKEQRLLAHLDGYDIEPKAREIRRVYKTKLSRQACEIAQKVEERAAQLRSKFASTTNEVKEFCLRCKFIDQGFQFISDSVLHSCKLQFDNGTHAEPEAKGIHECEKTYGKTMAIATAIANVKHPTNAIDHDYSPLRQIQDRAIHVTKERRPKDGSHVCESKPVHLKEDRIVTMLGGTQYQERAIIYAPPGFGKTTLQHWLMRRGIAVVDLDDRASTTLQECEDMLEITSVITNRLDIALQTEKPMIFFKPCTPRVLQERNKWGLTDEDALYWFNQHNKIRIRPRLAICEVTETYLTDWFVTSHQKIDEYDNAAHAAKVLDMLSQVTY